MSKTISSTIEKVSPKQAELWLEYNFDKQRPVSKKWVDFLVEEMNRGNFSPTAVISFAQINGKSAIINGQHTLRAIVKSRKTQNLPVIRHYPNTDDELNKLYAHYDIGRVRTFADSVRVYNVAGNLGLTDYDVNRLASAIRYIESKFNKGFQSRTQLKLSNEDVISLVYDWAEYYKIYQDVITPCSTWARKRLLVRSIQSVGLITMKYQNDTASSFWNQVARDDGLRRNDPRKALNSKLLTIDTLIKNKVMKGQSILMRDDIQTKIATHCWNKYLSGNSLTIVQETVVDKWDHLQITGTPFAIDAR